MSLPDSIYIGLVNCHRKNNIIAKLEGQGSSELIRFGFCLSGTTG